MRPLSYLFLLNFSLCKDFWGPILLHIYVNPPLPPPSGVGDGGLGAGALAPAPCPQKILSPAPYGRRFTPAAGQGSHPGLGRQYSFPRRTSKAWYS